MRQAVFVPCSNGVMRQGKKQSYGSLQAGRGIAAILVVIFHTASFVGGNSKYWHREWLARGLAGLALGVEYFFVLSGAVILLAHMDDIGRPATLPSYLWKRFRRVYPIYWIVLTALIFGYKLRPGIGAEYLTHPWAVVSGYLLVYVHTPALNVTILPVAWTLFHEVLFYAVFILFLIGRKIGLAGLALWCALSIVSLVHPWGLYYALYLFSPLHLLFAEGMLVAWLLRREKVRGATAFLATGACVFLVAMVLAGMAGVISDGVALIAGAGAAFLVLGAARLEEQGKLVVSGGLRFMGDASYSIYLIHYPFFMFMAPVAYKLWLRFPVPIAVPFVLLTLSAIAVGSAMHVYVERPLLKRLRAR